jgi:hypothetical protein
MFCSFHPSSYTNPVDHPGFRLAPSLPLVKLVLLFLILKAIIFAIQLSVIFGHLDLVVE